MDNDLLQLLESVGLKPKEARVYLALLELKQGSVTQIAKLAELKRSIIYVILADLIKKGYVSQLPDKKINEYQALDSSVIVTSQKGALKNFSEMLPYLQTLHNKGKKRPKIHYLENKEGIWKIYEEMNYAKEAFFITSYIDIEKHFPGGVQKWINDYKAKHYTMLGRHLIPDNPDELKYVAGFKKLNQKVKILPGVKRFSMDFTIFENKLTLTSLEEEPFMVLIESEELVNSMRPIFEIAWKAGRTV